MSDKAVRSRAGSTPDQIAARGRWSLKAVEYVKSQGVVACNENILTLLNPARGMKLLATRVQTVTDNVATLDGVHDIAEWTLICKGGNCLEQAAVAFVYLLANAPAEAFPIYYAGHRKGLGHAFVLLGKPENDRGDLSPDVPEEWGNGVYVCDPWRGVTHKGDVWAEAQDNLDPKFIGTYIEVKSRADAMKFRKERAARQETGRKQAKARQTATSLRNSQANAKATQHESGSYLRRRGAQS